jgi:hypothetical protein
LEEIIPEDSERNRDNSGNRPHTSVSGEHPLTIAILMFKVSGLRLKIRYYKDVPLDVFP